MAPWSQSVSVCVASLPALLSSGEKNKRFALTEQNNDATLDKNQENMKQITDKQYKIQTMTMSQVTNMTK